jgi:heat shock protein HslJ
MAYRAVIALSLAVLAACAPAAPPVADGLAGTSWRLVAIGGVAVPGDLAGPVTLTFGEGGSFAGQAPCNRYSGTNTAGLPGFRATAIGGTEMACDRLALEGDYYAALMAMEVARATPGRLVLSNRAGGSVDFARAP